MVKLTGLSRLNVRAIEECWPREIEVGMIHTTTTTATFRGWPGGMPEHAANGDQARAWATEVGRQINRLPGRSHPKASLHAVKRRLLAQTSS